ncbi:MAG: alpha/beta hydrolase domain-containing protein [Pseudomonadota bacterium]|nr:alpha/beta hydrolase domain-containing protein [Pseudomonadota bacterium]
MEALERQPYENGRSFGAAGPYERIDAIAHYAVDPTHAANQGIVDLALAERDGEGRVRFSGDMTLLMPRHQDRGNRALIMHVPNRGGRQLSRLNLYPRNSPVTAAVDPGDGFLFERGWTVGWAGWQWDVPRSPERVRIGLAAPEVPPAARQPDGRMQLRLQIYHATSSLPLTDQHVGDHGDHRLIRSADVNDADATLLVRQGPYGEARTVPRDRWRFAREVNGHPVEDDGHIWVDGGFEAGLTYDVLYTPLGCPVVGAGLLATRDLASYLRYQEDAPTAGSIEHVIAEGQSQCGRFLRTYLHLGLNNDETGRPVFDGVLAHIAGGRRGEFNNRHGQPSVQPTPLFGHLFPFADDPQTDPLTGQTAGLLDRQRQNGGSPKIIYTDTSSEYWRGDASLTHTDLASGGDCELPGDVRRYLFSSTQHSAGEVPLTNQTVFGGLATATVNTVDYRPLYRAPLMNLLAWVADGVEPPASAYPQVSAATRRSRRAVMETLSAIPGLALPDAGVLTNMYPLDLGDHADRGIATPPAKVGLTPYPDWVSSVDADGNEAAGIPMPDITVPVATHTGFNPRHPDTGGPGELLEYIGSTVPFAATEEDRATANDPRPSLTERYTSRDDYLDRIRRAAKALVEQRYLLAADIEVCVDIAAERYDACVAEPHTKERG